MNKTYYLNGEAFTFETQEELDAWLAENPGASETNDKVSFKPNIFENTESCHEGEPHLQYLNS